MSLFAITRSRGPAWNDALPLEGQEAWHAHAAFMDGLYEEGFALLVGPLEGTRDVLLIVQSRDAEEVRRKLEPDPWNGRLLTPPRIAPWTLRLGSLGR